MTKRIQKVFTEPFYKGQEGSYRLEVDGKCVCFVRRSATHPTKYEKPSDTTPPQHKELAKDIDYKEYVAVLSRSLAQ